MRASQRQSFESLKPSTYSTSRWSSTTNDERMKGRTASFGSNRSVRIVRSTAYAAAAAAGGRERIGGRRTDGTAGGNKKKKNRAPNLELLDFGMEKEKNGHTSFVSYSTSYTVPQQ